VLDASYYPSDIRIPGIEDTDEAYDEVFPSRWVG
jgi:D-alanyl-D-alanine carboxypeptidase/D-alanyl-D-alanine-endopeptidase (penicillin-binding protein 4)